MYVYSSTPTFASIRNTITILIWNVNGYDMTTTYVHKVEDAEHKYFWAYVFNTVGIYCMMFLVKFIRNELLSERFKRVLSLPETS